MSMDKLVGNTITDVYMSDDNIYLGFMTTEGKCIIFSADNDCCNAVWFNHLSGLPFLIGGRVSNIVEKDWIDMTSEEAIADGYDWPDVEEKGFWTIVTNKGYCDVEVRNSHNGYYGGNVGYSKTITKEEMFADLLDGKGDIHYRRITNDF